MRDLKEELRSKNGRAGFIAAVAAMIEGLKQQDQRSDFTIDMSSYGEAFSSEEHGEKKCFGCAATCAIQQYFGVNFDIENISNCYVRSIAINVPKHMVASFENAIEYLRNGRVWQLSEICELNIIDHEIVDREFNGLPELTDHFWKKHIPFYEAALDATKTAFFENPNWR